MEKEDSDNDSLADIDPFHPEIEQETIATKDFNTSTVHLNLNVINPERKAKKYKDNSIMVNKDVNIFA